MNILFSIGSYYPSQQGGPCNSVHDLGKGLVKRGHRVQVITTNFDISDDAGIPFDQWIDVDGVQVYYIRMPKTKRPFVLDLLLLARPFLLTGILKDVSCDVMNTNMLYTILSHISAGYAKEHNIPLVWTPHGSLLPYTFSRGTLKKKMFLSMPWVKKGLTGCHFHVTSDEEERYVREFIKDYTGESLDRRIHNIPILFGEEIFVPGDEDSPYPFRYLLHLGRIHPKKRIENLIEGFAKLTLRDNDLKLVIAGWTGEVPEYTRTLKGLVEKLNLGDRVVFTEKRVEGRAKATLYRHAEVFVLPSESENFGMVVLESLAQGVPVIASNKTPWQVLEQKGAGYWVPNGPASLARALERFFAQSDTERKSMKENAIMLAREYRGEALIEKYVKMYERVIKK